MSVCVRLRLLSMQTYMKNKCKENFVYNKILKSPPFENDDDDDDE